VVLLRSFSCEVLSASRDSSSQVKPTTHPRAPHYSTPTHQTSHHQSAAQSAKSDASAAAERAREEGQGALSAIKHHTVRCSGCFFTQAGLVWSVLWLIAERVKLRANPNLTHPSHRHPSQHTNPCTRWTLWPVLWRAPPTPSATGPRKPRMRSCTRVGRVGLGVPAIWVPARYEAPCFEAPCMQPCLAAAATERSAADHSSTPPSLPAPLHHPCVHAAEDVRHGAHDVYADVAHAGKSASIR